MFATFLLACFLDQHTGKKRKLCTPLWKPGAINPLKPHIFIERNDVDHLLTLQCGPLIDPKTPRAWTTYWPYSVYIYMCVVLYMEIRFININVFCESIRTNGPDSPGHLSPQTLQLHDHELLGRLSSNKWQANQRRESWVISRQDSLCFEVRGPLAWKHLKGTFPKNTRSESNV